MSNLTPVQQKSVQAWAEQRDALLRDIGVLSTARDQLSRENTEKGLASADLDIQIAEKRGRIAELEAIEARMRGSVASDIVGLQSQKSALEGEIAVILEKIRSASERYDILHVATSDLAAASAAVGDQGKIITSAAGELADIVRLAGSDMKASIDEIRSVADQVIEKGNENISQAGIVLDKLPRYIFELQKPIPVRRTYRAPKGSVILPESGTEIKNP